jgi:hypothetical protein
MQRRRSRRAIALRPERTDRSTAGRARPDRRRSRPLILTLRDPPHPFIAGREIPHLLSRTYKKSEILSFR